MAEIPQIDPFWSGSFELDAPPCLADHHLQGRAVLPAVESLRLLARAMEENGLSSLIPNSSRADFIRFIPTPPAGSPLELPIDLTREETGAVRAVLSTRTSSRNGAITRTKKHVTVLFNPPEPTLVPPLDILAVPDGPGLTIPAQALYDQLVPFGPSFQNIVGPVHLAPGGASALVRAPADLPGSGPLGSPFPLDAAFHLASAWGQGRHDLTGFPVGYDRRVVFDPTRPGGVFFARVFPRPTTPDLMVFDLWVLDLEGRPREAVFGLGMKEVAGGRVKAPEWVREKARPELEALRAHCREMVVLELPAIPSFALRTLSPRELKRAEGLGEKRKKSFISSRLALKRLSRILGRTAADVPAPDLDVLAPDGVRPTLAGLDLPCSVAHDDRFVVAVAGPRPLGVDVETDREAAVKGLSIYASAREKRLVEQSELGLQAAATRLWTIKEAASKALGMELTHAWSRTEARVVGRAESRLLIEGHETPVWHAEVDGHVFSLLTL
ncbi:MAG: polyketide synthase dehydratase domain-containing protein [Pseudomonadota bacterium]